MALLEVRDVTMRFGGIVALDGVSFDVEQGHISGLIGPNGAGKTTAFNVITRLYKPDDGEVTFDGESLLETPPHGVVRRGIARTFQNVELFPSMTVRGKVGAARDPRVPRARATRGTARPGVALLDAKAHRARPGARLGAATAPAR